LEIQNSTIEYSVLNQVIGFLKRYFTPSMVIPKFFPIFAPALISLEARRQMPENSSLTKA
jgi:hypothetical protein